jgi:riboflavin kinase / FMN adenylyltransferase
MTPSAVVIGNFDGVHRGHQAVLADLGPLAAARGLRPLLLTFEPHPAVTLGRQPPPLLTTIERKIELCQRYCRGIEVVVRPFTREFSNQTPEEFAARVLVGDLRAGAVMVGLNFRFGHDRAGGIDDLERLGGEMGFEVLAEPLVHDDKGAWSSTRVRGLLAAADLDGAAAILGRPHMVSGSVAEGDRRGRQLGFPTANLPDVPEELPPFGVYAVVVDRVDTSGPRALAKGVANIGVRPTVKDTASKPLLEVHLFDLDENLYGQRLRVHLVARLRDEQRFAGLDALRAQIMRDAAAARAALAGWAPDPSLDGAWA